MIKKRRFPKIFFGWWTVLTGGFLCLWGYGYYMYGLSALFGPIASELGFSRAIISGAASIGRFAGGFESPLTGWITDKFGPRLVILLGTFLMGLGFLLMNFVNSLWAYYVVWGVIAGTGVNVALALPLDKAVTSWFVKKRGKAQSIRWMLTMLSGAAVLPIVARLISTQGWRMTCVIGGLVMWLVGLPLVWFFVKKHRPEYYGLLPDGATAEAELEEDASQMIDRGVKYAAEVQEVEFTLRQAMRTPAYWLLIIALTGLSMAAQVVLIHGVPFLIGMGIDPIKAASMVAIVILGMFPSMFIGGFLSDRVTKDFLRFLVGGAFFLQAAGITIFLLNQTITMAYVFLLLFYIGQGVVLPLNPIIKARYFGRKGFGSIQGTSMIFLTPLGIASPIYAGWVYDTTGSYVTVFTLLVGLYVFSAVVMLLTRPPKPPAQVTDVHQFI